MEGLGATLGMLPFGAHRTLSCGWIVVPGFMGRPFTALEALRLRPLDATPWADATCPERVPRGAARMDTLPAVLGLGPPLAVRAVNLGFSLHGTPGHYQRQTSVRLSHGTRCLARWRASSPEANDS